MTAVVVDEQLLDHAGGERLAYRLRSFGQEQAGLVAVAAAQQSPSGDDPGRPLV